ncbi:hypothetical protein OSB04_015935 [Centaurea solstitialis]|uniref:Uncharacterized protein n=1 Tax=Centaurea solstitialis TaxID=347529 RepID=A0AA38TBW6_9ASTR|nr:hypothetical protein OSB04_015935 [Centaurea solstitialis]
MIPSMIRDLNPKEFNPRQVSIGPLHRKNKNLEAFEGRKALFLQDLLDQTGIPQEQTLEKCVEKVKASIAMDRLIDTHEEVAILVKSKVLVNSIGSNEEAAKMINDLRKDISCRLFLYKDVWNEMNTYHTRVNKKLPSIHMIPSMIRDLNPKDFNPRQVSIGPLHRKNKNLEAFEGRKAIFLQDLLD